MTAPHYVSDAKRHRAQWMTFPEAVAEVAKRVRCDPDSADQQVRDALSDGKLMARWEDSLRGPPAGRPYFADAPPPEGDMWSEPDGVWHSWSWRKVVFREDMLFDPFKQRWRRLLLARLSVRHVWPERPPAASQPEGSPPKVGAPNKIERVKGLLSGVEFTTFAEKARHVQEMWPKNAGKCPSDRTIQRAVKEMRGKKLSKTEH